MGEGRIVFSGARLLDGEHPARSGMSVVVEGRRIAAVEPGAPPTRPGERRIELGGRTLMPGMVQGHFHSGFGHFGSGLAAPMLGLEAPTAYLGMLAAKNARTALHCGFTSVIGSSNGQFLDVCLKDAITNGVVEGPRMLACSHEFATSGEMADGTNRSWFMDLGNHGLIRRVDGPDAFRQAAREELGRGCDLIKVSVAPGHGAMPTADLCYVTRDELDALVETAHARGKRVRAHCPSRKAVLACARAGVDIIDHADRMDAECIEAILEAGSSVCPSMLWSVRYLGFAQSWDYAQGAFPIGDGFPESAEDTQARLRGVREDFEHTCRIVPEANRAGVRLLVGDDFGTPFMPHGDYISEFEVYTKQLGIPALDVIRWATKHGAEAMGRAAELGTVEAGKLADLLVVDGDPSSDVGCLRDPARMHAILKDGAFVKDALGAVAG
jgi:imidazolonepropionase-like amidohydrolase